MAKPQVNNEVYRQYGHLWWDDDVGGFSSIRFFVNPVRFGYFIRVIEQYGITDHAQRTVLDVGCGGGFLSEEFARHGYRVTGVDPAFESVEAARAHAAKSGLAIRYETGSGEALPFADASFDLVTCCDVLEHVDSVDRVISEIARVLKPGGFFFYDTVNRTFVSKIAVIKVMQEWPSTAFVPPNCHVWDKFIKPNELIAFLARHGLDNREMRGISPRRNFIAAWLDTRRRGRGQITFKELGRRLRFHESNDLIASYMGYAVKQSVGGIDNSN